MSQRILIGTSEIAKTVFNLTKGFREIGYEADSLVANQNRHRFYTDAAYSITDMDYLKDVSFTVNQSGDLGVKLNQKFLDLVDSYDIFVFVSSASLLPRLIDLPLLRDMGKTIILRQCGTEVRDTELAKIFWDSYSFSYPFYDSDKETPKIKCSGMTDLFSLTRYHPALASKTHNTRMGEYYGDIVISASECQTLGIKPFYQTGPVIDSNQFICKIPKRRRPLIVHAPSNVKFKRTKEIVETLKELEEEGLSFDLKILHNVPHEQVRHVLSEADILIDSLSCGTGFLAYEGAASGCVVLGGHDGVASILPRNRPVLFTTVDTLKENVKRVVLDVVYRARLAQYGRDFIDMGIGSPASVAQYLLNAVERARQNDYDLYPMVFTQKCELPPGQMMPSYLKELTFKVMLEHGVHPDTDLARIARSGLMPQVSDGELSKVPRWDTSQLAEEGPWVITGPNATYGLASQGSEALRQAV